MSEDKPTTLPDAPVEQLPRRAEPASAAGCLPFAAVIMAVVISAAAWFIYPVVWLAEQLTTVQGGDWSRMAWPATVLIHGLLVALPAGLLARRAGSARYRGVFRTWALAGVFALFTIPIHFAGLTAAMSAAALQIVCALLFSAALWFAHRRPSRLSIKAGRPYWPAWLAAGLIVWPWFLWGALGSWLDALLNGAAAGLLGLATGALLGWTLLPDLHATGNRRENVALGGLAAAPALATMGATYGVNGQQLILMLLLPALAWLLLVVAYWGRGERPADGRPAMGLLIGLVAAGPLLLIDPDELMLILNLGTRDVGYWAAYATLLSTLAALGLSLIAALLSRRLSEQRNGRTGPLFAGGAWLLIFLLYFLVGQPGWHGERLFVILKDQVDLTAATGMAGFEEQRQYVYETLTAHSEAEQAGLRRALDRFGVAYRPYYLINALEVDAGPIARYWLSRRPEVDRVLESPLLRPLPAEPPKSVGDEIRPTEPGWNLLDIGAPQVWAETGVTGEGVVIGLSDSGADGRHPELARRYRGRTTGSDDYNWYDPWNGTTSPADTGGHGTHVLGTILGETVGVAPDAAWIGCVNLPRNLGNPADYVECLQFLFAPFPQAGDPARDGRPDLGAHVLNNSWGCPEVEGCDADALLAAARALRAAGVFFVASAGNEGDACGSVSDPPALYEDVFSVGAYDESGGMAPFSSRGPVSADGSGRTKPDIAAPGVGILSAYPGGGYAYNDGTSMAGPHVAGVVALMWSANPDLIGDVDRTEGILAQTARPYQPGDFVCGAAGQPNNVAGYGFVDALAAVREAMAAKTP